LTKKNEYHVRIGVFADFHCGHRVGLVPPEFMAGERKYLNRQHDRWTWFTKTVDSIRPLDGAIFLGDLCDGLGVTDVSECIIPDLNRQIRAAADIVKAINAPKNYFVYGTRVHVRTKDGLELEQQVAELCNGKIHGQIWLSVGKFIIDARHAPAGKSYAETSRANPLIPAFSAYIFKRPPTPSV